MLVIIGIDILLVALALWLGIHKKRAVLALILFVGAVLTTVIYSYVIRNIPSSAEMPSDIFNPTKYVQLDEYAGFWKTMFSTLLSGFWARFIAVASLLAAFWFGVYRRKTGMGIFLFLISVTATYMFGFMKLLWR